MPGEKTMNEFETLLARATAPGPSSPPVATRVCRRDDERRSRKRGCATPEWLGCCTTRLNRWGIAATPKHAESSRVAHGGSPLRNRSRSSRPALRAAPAVASSALKPTMESFDGSGAFLVGTGGRLVRLNPWASSRGLQSDREHSATVIARARCVHSLFHDR